METRFAFLKPEDICPKQNLKISQSQPQKNQPQNSPEWAQTWLKMKRKTFYLHQPNI